MSGAPTPDGRHGSFPGIAVGLAALLGAVVALTGLLELTIVRELGPSLLAAAWISLAALGFGRLTVQGLGRWSASAATALSPVAAWLLGCGVLQLGVIAFGLLGLLSRVAAVLLLTAGTVLALPDLRRWLLPRAARLRSRLATLPLVAAVLPVLAATFLASLPPTTWFDALEYHLVIPQAYVLAGGLIEMPDNFFSHLPHGVELLDTLLLCLSLDFRVEPFHWLQAIVCAWAVGDFARRHLHRAAGPLAAAIFLVSRQAALSSFVAGVDLMQAACFVVACDLALRARRRDELAVVALLLAGLGATFKVLGLIHALILGLTCVAWVRPSPRRLVLGLVAALGPVLPYAAINVVRHGNPGYPFLGRLFGTTDEEQQWLAWIARYTDEKAALGGGELVHVPAAFLRTLLDVGEWTPLALLALGIPFLRRRRAAGRCAGLLALLSLLGWWLATPVPRYGIVVQALMAALAAATMLSILGRRDLRRLRPVLVGLIVVLLGVSTLHRLRETGRSRDPLAYLVGSESADQYRARTIPASPSRLFELANEQLPTDAVVLSIDEARTWGLHRECVVATYFDRSPLRHHLEGDPDAAELARRLKEAGFTHLLTNDEARQAFLGVVQNPTRPVDQHVALVRRLLADHAELVLTEGPASLWSLRSPDRR
ncbi:MAG: hypothetical protein AAF533_25970 [Acidobacteriota bacterium]